MRGGRRDDHPDDDVGHRGGRGRGGIRGRGGPRDDGPPGDRSQGGPPPNFRGGFRPMRGRGG